MNFLRVGLVALGLCAASLSAGVPRSKITLGQETVLGNHVDKKLLVKPVEIKPHRAVLAKPSVVDAVEFVYRRVDVLDAVNPFVIHFSSTETSANLKDAFASAQSHRSVSTSIVPAIKNLLEFVNASLTHFSTKGIKELSRTLKIELKDPKESVLAEIFFKKTGYGKDTKITAYVTLKGLATKEPEYIRHLLAAALLEDSFWQMHGKKVLGGVAGIAGAVSFALLTKDQGWWPFGLNDNSLPNKENDDVQLNLVELCRSSSRRRFEDLLPPDSKTKKLSDRKPFLDIQKLFSDLPSIIDFNSINLDIGSSLRVVVYTFDLTKSIYEIYMDLETIKDNKFIPIFVYDYISYSKDLFYSWDLLAIGQLSLNFKKRIELYHYKKNFYIKSFLASEVNALDSFFEDINDLKQYFCKLIEGLSEN